MNTAADEAVAEETAAEESGPVAGESAAARTVRKALIPAAGQGTRMAPFSTLVPKELVPIGSVPVLQFILEEALSAGIEEVGIVVRPGKGDAIERFVDQFSPRCESSRGETVALRVTWIEQQDPRGLGDAIVSAADFLGTDAFALLLPDNLLPSAEHRLADLMQCYEQRGLDVLGVLELTHEQSGEYGDCGLFESSTPDERYPRVLHLERLHPKGPGRLEVAPGEVKRRTCGRSICSPDFLEELKKLRAACRGELDEVPANQNLIARRGATGFVLAGPVFDVGYPLGYLAACAWFYERERRLREN